ncbi:two-component system sporulation sensor kinase B [Neobacillus niacini]|uniref:histidine kinase dimerization/phospho-acceptor domain-containing protein n=1 Tax=Neobacillus driksii TaxID=3035913 RepID=UPI0027837466|nr:histidine kinase dimerization/phospho-acceptor domain-containing protein [Neobacillus niacini]MDQ0970217.1 two-component system sporulation sensor kinase B [Neobacillus niacini]
MSIIKDFLLQLTFMLIPIFIYYTFITERVKNYKNREVTMTILWGISIIACMSFPVVFGQNARLELRIIPLLLGTLYGGFLPGIFLSALIILYRLSFGMDIGFYNTVLVLLLSLPVIVHFQKSFASSKKDRRVKIAVGLSFYYCLIGLTLLGILRGFSKEYLTVPIIHLFFAVLVTWCFTMLIEAIREIHQLRLDMQNSEKLRVIGELTSVFAHEIRNPMQATRGFLQLLNEPDLSDKKKEYIQISLEELDRANEIINDFLSLGKPSIEDKKRINIGYQIQRVVNIIQSYTLNRNVEIETDILENCWIYVNPQRLNQSLINILKNAIESMPNGWNGLDYMYNRWSVY